MASSRGNLTKIPVSTLRGDVSRELCRTRYHRWKLLNPTRAGKRRTLGEQILDYVEGGPKLRKWYGLGDTRDQDEVSEDPQTNPTNGTENLEGAVLVIGADSPTGELVVMQLVLSNSRVKALVRDAEAERIAYGSYVDPIGGDSNDYETVKRAMKGAKSVIVLGKLGCVAEVAAGSGSVEHIVLLSSVRASQGGSTGFEKLFGGEKAIISSFRREQKVIDSGIPYTIVRVVDLKDVPFGGPSDVKLGAPGTLSNSISRADAAMVLVNSLQYPPKKGKLFEASGGEEALKQDWKSIFSAVEEN